MSHSGSSKAILYALLANAGIAIAKTFAAIYTGSGSMLAEAIHSFADCGNQVLLFFGMNRAKRRPDREHPLGYGKAVYFWSFIVAILLFSMGGVFSIYEGIHKLSDTEPLHDAWVALTVLGVSIILEGMSLFGAIKEINKLKKGKPLFQWLNTSRNAELVVVFGEDLAAITGLTLAFIFLLIADITGLTIYDAIGSICIGIILIIVSLFVATRIKSLLIGRSADPEITEKIESFIASHEGIEKLFNVITLQLGPDIMLAAKIKLSSSLTIDEGVQHINMLEEAIRKEFPEVRWSFVEPDIKD